MNLMSAWWPVKCKYTIPVFRGVSSFGLWDIQGWQPVSESYVRVNQLGPVDIRGLNNVHSSSVDNMWKYNCLKLYFRWNYRTGHFESFVHHLKNSVHSPKKWFGADSLLKNSSFLLIDYLICWLSEHRAREETDGRSDFSVCSVVFPRPPAGVGRASKDQGGSVTLSTPAEMYVYHFAASVLIQDTDTETRQTDDGAFGIIFIPLLHQGTDGAKQSGKQKDWWLNDKST